MGLKDLIRLLQIKTLNLVGADVSDEGVQSIVEISDLKGRCLNYTPLTDKGLQPLANSLNEANEIVAMVVTSISNSRRKKDAHQLTIRDQKTAATRRPYGSSDDGQGGGSVYFVC